MAIEINEAGQPTNLVAFSQGDKISNEILNTEIVNAASEVSAVSSTVFTNSGTWGTGGGGIDPYLLEDITEVSTGFQAFSGNIQTCTVFVSGVVDNLETSSRNMSGIVDSSFSDLQTSTRNMSGIVDTDFSDLQTSTRNLSSIVDSSFSDLETSTRNMSGIVDAISQAGSAVASAIAVGNGSSVIVSGADTPGTGIDAPTNNMALVIDTAAGKVAFKKIRGGTGGMIGAGSIGDAELANDSVGVNQLQTGAASGNIVIGGLALNKLIPIAAGNFLGNPNTLGAPVEAVDKATARNMLGVSAGTAAPPSPAEGDLWYNTTHDELYTYDSGRGHWLGCPYYISMGKANAATGAGVGHFLYVGHQGTAATTQEKGWLVPHDMVITGWRGHSSTTFDGWNVRIDKNSAGTNTTGIVQTGALGSVDTFSDFTLDVDVAAGDILGVAIVLGSVTIDASTVIIKIQRKGA